MKRADKNALLSEALLEAHKLTAPEARLIVANYYAAQEMRKRLDMQLRHWSGKGEVDLGANDADKIVITDNGDVAMTALPSNAPRFLQLSADHWALQEKQTQRMLKAYAESNIIGRWALSHVGVGPVIVAGLLAHLDITKAPSAGHFWAFAGLDPTRKWEKGQKRPYNADLKQLGYHFGECAKRVSNNPDSYYGKLYRARKAELVASNAAGKNAERAKTFVTRSADVKKVLAEGRLPDGNIDRQACNWVFKIFLSHLHAVMYWDHYGKAPPRPFAIQHLGHVHEIAVPNADMFPGFWDAYYGETAVQKAA